MHCFKSLFYKSKEAKSQRLRKNIFTKLSSFFSCFCEIVHSFIFFIFDQTCNGAKHESVLQTGRRGLVQREAQM